MSRDINRRYEETFAFLQEDFNRNDGIAAEVAVAFSSSFRQYAKQMAIKHGIDECFMRTYIARVLVHCSILSVMSELGVFNLEEARQKVENFFFGNCQKKLMIA